LSRGGGVTEVLSLIFSDRLLHIRLDMIKLSSKKLEFKNGNFIFKQFPFNHNYMEVKADC
jgi:hypothetical protein